MNRNKTILLGASALVAGAVIAGGVNLASAATGGSTPTPGTHGYGFGPGSGYGPMAGGPMGDRDGDGPMGGELGGRGPGGPGGHEHTLVTGSEKTKVTDAVTSKYSDVTVQGVMKDEDGSYDVMATQDGKPVMVEVSKDLATIELRTGPAGGPGMRGPGGPMGGPDEGTALTGTAKAKVVSAVEAKYPSVTVEDVFAKPDGSFHVHATRDSEPVRLEVSKDLTTIELHDGPPAPPAAAPTAPEGAPTPPTAPETSDTPSSTT